MAVRTVLQKSQKRKRLKILQMHHQPEYFTSVDIEFALCIFSEEHCGKFFIQDAEEHFLLENSC
jgi:hypothetical protein